MPTANHRPDSDRRRGATLVEFALSFLLFLLLMIATVEGGLMIWTYTTLAHATRQAGRYAMVHGRHNPVSDGAVRDRLTANAVGLDSRQLSVAIDWKDPAKAGGSIVEIQAAYPLRFFTTGLIFGRDAVTLRTTTQMVLAE
jgi:hypothetical protein